MNSQPVSAERLSNLLSKIDKTYFYSQRDSARVASVEKTSTGYLIRFPFGYFISGETSIIETTNLYRIVNILNLFLFGEMVEKGLTYTDYCNHGFRTHTILGVGSKRIKVEVEMPNCETIGYRHFATLFGRKMILPSFPHDSQTRS